jgi:hypothetical protein
MCVGGCGCSEPEVRAQSQALEVSAYVSIRQHTSAYVSIRQHTSAYVTHLHLVFLSVQPREGAHVSEVRVRRTRRELRVGCREEGAARVRSQLSSRLSS